MTQFTITALLKLMCGRRIPCLSRQSDMKLTWKSLIYLMRVWTACLARSKRTLFSFPGLINVIIYCNVWQLYVWVYMSSAIVWIMWKDFNMSAKDLFCSGVKGLTIYINGIYKTHNKHVHIIKPYRIWLLLKPALPPENFKRSDS